MNHLHDAHSAGMYTLPDAVLTVLAVLYFLGGCFYTFRVLTPKHTRRVIGFYDMDGETGHAICMFAMASAMFPLANLPNIFWAITLGLAGAWVLIRALTWGRRLPWNVWWWDWAHTGMLLGMALMFTTFKWTPLSVVSLVFWGWFSWHYIGDVYNDSRHKPVDDEPPLRKPFFVASDACHLGMGLAMLVMTISPSLLMPRHGDHQSPGETAAAVETPEVAAIVTLTDENFEEMRRSEVPVLVLAFGGCEKCNKDAVLFAAVSENYRPHQAIFVKVNKDDSPALCEKLGVKECPAVLTIKGGKIAEERLGTFNKREELTEYIETQLRGR